MGIDCDLAGQLMDSIGYRGFGVRANVVRGGNRAIVLEGRGYDQWRIVQRRYRAGFRPDELLIAVGPRPSASPILKANLTPFHAARVDVHRERGGRTYADLGIVENLERREGLNYREVAGKGGLPLPHFV